MEEIVTKTAISLTTFERDIVVKESERRGLHNFSGTLRMIIREWAAVHNPAYLPTVATEAQEPSS